MKFSKKEKKEIPFPFFFWKGWNNLFSLFFSFFPLSHFSIFFNVKNGITPLFIAAQNGREQIVQILLEKGKPNVHLPMKVFLFENILFFSFKKSFSHFLPLFFFIKGCSHFFFFM